MLQNQNLESYEKFFETAGVLDGRQMEGAEITYLAFKIDGRWQLVRAKLFLEGISGKALAPYETASVRVGRHTLVDLGTSVKQFLDDSLTASALHFPEGICTFKCDTYGHSTHVTDLHHDGLREGTRLRMLTITGENTSGQFSEPVISWELKSHAQPYDSLQELTHIYGTGFPGGGQLMIEIIGYQTTAIETALSTINGSVATICQALLKGFSPEKASLGYIVYKSNIALQRGSFTGSEIEWSTGASFQSGCVKLTVEPGSVVKCFARYGGITHHERWVVDPTFAQNSRRNTYETFDEGLVALKSLLDGPYVKGRDARQVETALTWLIWMCGFSPIQIGGNSKTQTGPDLIVAAPNGNLAVIECTTGLLSADKKLPQLVARTVQVRRKLDAVGNASVQLISVLITTRTREEVRAELDQATRADILVATREDIETALSRSIVSMDANALYDFAVATLKERQLNHKQPFGAPI